VDKNLKLSKLIKDKNKAHKTSTVYFIIGGILFVFGLIFMLVGASEVSKFSKLQDICDASRLTGFANNVIRENCEEVSDSLSLSYGGLVGFALPLIAGFLLIIAGILDYRKYQKLNRKLEEQQENEEKDEEQNNKEET
jgi:UDP-N-acetylmuramyl pentapeptide phosphotransferase/UDP-N-acetylglucosamine-1-phosphate transferase